MKRIITIVCIMLLVLMTSGCAAKTSDNKISAPDDFSFSLRWDWNGNSYYESESGKLIKAQFISHPEEYTTEYKMTEEQLNEIYRLVLEMDPKAYPDEYNPIKGASKPSRDIVLIVSYNGSTKKISCRDISLENEPVDKAAEKFMAVHDKIVEILTSTDEWKALPESPVIGTLSEDLEFSILQDVTDTDFSDYICDFASLGSGGVYFGKRYNITPTMEMDYEEPYVEYTLNQWPDLSDERTHITNIRITDPDVRIYGLCLESAAEEWQKVLSREGYSIREDEDLRADVIADSPDGYYTIYYSADPLRIIIDAPTTNRNGIIID